MIYVASIDRQVNNAAQVILKPAVECSGEDYAGIMATNLESCFHLSQLAHPLLRNASVAGGGSVVHISSTAGCLGVPGVVLYSIAKGTHFKEHTHTHTHSINPYLEGYF